MAKNYGLLTKCEVKITGYWPSFFCVFMDLDFVSVNKLAKKERDQYPVILTEQAGQWRIYYTVFGQIFLAGYSGYSQAGKTAPSCPLGQPIIAQDSVHLARSYNNVH